ncbi:DUF1311 domain-containing protein [Rhodobacteraceae bacterium]|nr:DUF1311 domain-containing protein [Paracoccaceae bacterium]
MTHVQAFVIAAVVALGAAPAALAEMCDDPVTQSDMNQCAYRDLQSADALLNTAYKEARARARAFGAENAAQLLGAQRAWIAFRDADCAARAEQYAGGSIQPLIHATCMTELTERRTQDLRQFYVTY